MGAFGRLFKGQGNTTEITAMCALQDLLAIGFSNGVLILFDIERLEITFQHKVR
jgi:hypothetical protein